MEGGEGGGRGWSGGKARTIREHGGVICMGMENILRFDNRSEQSSASVRQKRGGEPEERIK